MEWVLDALLALCLVLTMIAGARAGFFRELFALLGLVLGIVLAMRLTPFVLGHIPRPMQGWTITSVVLFLLIFLAAFAILRIVGAAFAALWEGKKPGTASRLLGLILGTLRGAVLVVVLAGAALLLARPGNAALSRSRVLPYCGPGIRAAARLLPPRVRTPLLQRWDALHHGTPRPVLIHDQAWWFPPEPVGLVPAQSGGSGVSDGDSCATGILRPALQSRSATCNTPMAGRARKIPATPKSIPKNRTPRSTTRGWSPRPGPWIRGTST
jgi:uncharacterized membrane protein required for colicin V production